MNSEAVVETGKRISKSNGFPLLPFFLSLRPRQWTKNVVVFAGAFGAGQLFHVVSFARASLGFLIFCGLAGVVYIINDLVDREHDRLHPRKRYRPIASGALPQLWAWCGAAVLLIACLLGSMALGLSFFGLSIAYVVLMLSYSYILKREIFLDVLTISAGFVIRAAAGAALVKATISPWLLVCAALLALFLGFSKRRHELLLLGDQAPIYRAVLQSYTPELLDELIAVVTSSTLVTYSLYTFFGENVPRNHTMMLTIPFVLYAVFRYMLLIHRPDGGGNPDELLLQDRPLLIAIILWAVTAISVLYFAPGA
ncbi:MAG: decaprenyl-phosphate phosphoribosyltransferase [Chloroflexi bacterium]|nr:decaprenyl-phosphate phosphoribosyltransferase [Chloroflexota bacterium]